MKKWLLTAFAMCSLLALSASAVAQAQFRLLQSPVGPTWANYSLSANGKTMAANYGGEIFRWTSAGGFVDLGLGDVMDSSIGISADGSTIVAGRVGPDGYTNPALWQQASGWIDLGHPSDGCIMDGNWGSGYGVNRDGTIAVGLAWYCPGAQGFSWTQQGGMVGLGHPDGASSRASAISANGSTIIGFYEHPTQGFRRPVRWVAGSPDLFAGEEIPGEATAVNSSGSKIGGQAWDGSGSHAFYYTTQSGLVSLGTLSGNPSDSSNSNGISDNGVVVGFSGDFFFGGTEAFVWSAQHGMRSLRKFLVRNGAVIPDGVFLDNALAISADGTTIVGTWSDVNFNQGGWIARIKKGMLN